MPNTGTTTEHTTRCQRCHRPLRTPISVAAGIGPRCARLAAAETAYTPAQVADAVELADDGGIIPLRGHGTRRVYLTVGHHGDVYRTAITGQCSCRAGVAGKRCFHAAAVQIRSGAVPTLRVAYPMPAATYIAAA
jgi:hypothetical protein